MYEAPGIGTRLDANRIEALHRTGGIGRGWEYDRRTLRRTNADLDEERITDAYRIGLDADGGLDGDRRASRLRGSARDRRDEGEAEREAE